MSLKEQQTAWLAESCKGLKAIAMKITGCEDKADEALAETFLAALTQIDADKCRATEKPQFLAWIRTITRNQCYSRLRQGSVDIPAERAVKAYRKEYKEDRRKTAHPPVDDDAWVERCYVRDETSGGDQ